MSQRVTNLETLKASSNTTSLERLLIRLRYEVKNAIAPYPLLYLPLARYSPVVRDAKRAALVGETTQLTIEAFQGSGNTYAMGLFKAMSLDIAHHAHAPAQVIASVKRGLPTLVIIREPEEAVLSFIVRSKVLTLSQALREYINYHKHIYPWRSGIVIATFGDVIERPERILERLDEKFGTEFSQTVRPEVPDVQEAVATWHSIKPDAKVYEADVPLPSKVRSERKEWLREELERPHLQKYLVRAREVYKRFDASL